LLTLKLFQLFSLRSEEGAVLLGERVMVIYVRFNFGDVGAKNLNFMITLFTLFTPFRSRFFCFVFFQLFVT
jgi:hypothetical protein